MMDNIKAFYMRNGIFDYMLYALLSAAAMLFIAAAIMLVTNTYIGMLYLIAVPAITLVASFVVGASKRIIVSRKTKIALIACLSLMLFALRLAMVA